MKEGRVAKMFIAFDGNFGVIASKKLGRLGLPEGVAGFGIGASRYISAHVIDDGDEKDALPSDSEAEGEQEAKEASVEGWVSIILSTEKRTLGRNDDKYTTQGVPFAVTSTSHAIYYAVR